MFCEKCGQELMEGQAFCPNCGAPAAVQPVAAPVQSEPAPAAAPVQSEPQFRQPAYEQPQYQQAQYQQPQYQQPQYQQPQYQQPYGVPQGPAKSKLAAGLLAIFLGSLGVHNFYLGFTKRAVAQLLISLLTFGIGAPIVAIWALIEGIFYLTGHEGYTADAKGVPLDS